MPLLALSPPTVPSLARAGLVATTRAEHQRMLKLLAEMPQDLRRLPLTTAVAELLLRRRKERAWRWSTTIKYLATAQGSLALLPLYRATTSSLILARCPVWTQTLRAAAQRARTELPRQPRATTWAEMKLVLDREPNTQVAIALLLGWFSAARLGCVLQLSCSDLTLHDNSRTVDVRFRAGKGVKARGPYTVTTPAIPLAYWTRLVTYLAQRPRFLFTKETTGAALKLALRRAHPENEQRSVRRGALQALAQSPGMTTATLMRFSGHTVERTLMRYLNWGRKALYQANADRVAAGSALTA